MHIIHAPLLPAQTLGTPRHPQRHIPLQTTNNRENTRGAGGGAHRQSEGACVCLVRTMSSTLRPPEMGLGNLPALFRPGPSRRGICLITASLARKAW